MSIRKYERPDPKIRYARTPVEPILEYREIKIDDSRMIAGSGDDWVSAIVLDDYMKYLGWNRSEDSTA